MRTIKFRAWHKEKNVMLLAKVGFQFEALDKGGIPFNDNHVFSLDPSYYTDCGGSCCCTPELHDLSGLVLMQSTDLLDKNGKEIYEGDIVRLESMSTVDAPIISSVVWKHGTFRDSTTGTYICWNTADEHPEIMNETPEGQWEVIGNIYENPELLK